MQHRLVAYNRAPDSPNRVHEPEFARSVGFRGGLVPGVDVFAYMAHLPAAAWGLEWLRRGGLEARFAQPVFDGDQLAVGFAEGRVEVVNGEGVVCAAGTAERRIEDPPPEVAGWPEAPLPSPLPPAAPEAFGPVLGSTLTSFGEAEARQQLEDVREPLDLYVRERVLHPGHLLRLADSILMANVELPPWMHVSSRARFFDLAHWDEPLSTRARLGDLFEKKGHRFVQLDVLVVGPRGPVLRVDPYMAIYRPAWAT